ncbi:hypothetical protein HYPSUDRAFT_205927 [Hypholoma sublateritium FD-334 SS-4]|uniref:Uncharacterized protein n=1 Tax=Hypholoma sublateritium (strain FD-334 SS-4) TaxID=945553 RepID=A0A0D2M3R7_HYPSF|nr:hypothetical protein HYPSUDRAFT_205927 [Hypholoma sublateritium FD-334 SS-4]
MREAEIVLSILRSEVQHTDHNVEEADVQVGMARAYLKSRTTYESEDDEVPPLLRNCDSDSAGSYTDSGSDHVTARSFLDTDFSSPGSHRLSEAALQQLDALSKPTREDSPPSLQTTSHPMSSQPVPATTDDPSLPPQQTRQNDLSNLISKPGTSRKKQVPAPTTGERGKALASQKRTRGKKNHEITSDAAPSIPEFVPIPFNASSSTPVDSSQGRDLQMQPPRTSGPMFQADGGAQATTSFNINDNDCYFYEGETTIQPDLSNAMFQISHTSSMQPPLDDNQFFVPPDYDNFTQSNTFAPGISNFPLRKHCPTHVVQHRWPLDLDRPHPPTAGFVQKQLIPVNPLGRCQPLIQQPRIPIGIQSQPQATRRRRRRRDELGNHNASTLPVLADYEQKSIDDMQALVKLKLLVENGFPEIAQKKEWANQAYGEAYVAAGFRKSLFEK